MSAADRSHLLTEQRLPESMGLDAMSAAELARGILAKEVRPRAGDIRRLAEAVLDGRGAKPKKGKK